MSKLVMINPVSGNKNAALLSSSGEVLNLVPKGTILKLVGSTPTNYIVEYDNNEPNRTVGTGYGNTGTIIAYPNTPLYENITKFKIKDYISNGTTVELIPETVNIYDDEIGENKTYLDYHKEDPYIKVKGKTNNGIQTGYVKAKHLTLDQQYGYMNPYYFGTDKDMDYYYDGYDNLVLFYTDYPYDIKVGERIEDTEESPIYSIDEEGNITPLYDEGHYWPTLEERATLEGMSLHDYLSTHFNLQMFAGTVINVNTLYTGSAGIFCYSDSQCTPPAIGKIQANSYFETNDGKLNQNSKSTYCKGTYISTSGETMYGKFYISNNSNVFIDENKTTTISTTLSNIANGSMIQKGEKYTVKNATELQIYTYNRTSKNYEPTNTYIPINNWYIAGNEMKDGVYSVEYNTNGKNFLNKNAYVKFNNGSSQSKNKPITTSSEAYIVGSNVNVRSDRSTNSSVVGVLTKNTRVAQYDVQNGWAKIVYEDRHTGDRVEGYVYQQYLSSSKSQTQAEVSKDDAEIIGGSDNYATNNDIYEDDVEVYTDDEDEWKQAFASLDFDIDSSFYNGNYNEEYYRKLAEKYSYALGAPPRYNMDIDIQYQDAINPGAGRVMNKTILRSPSILSICPGKVTMFPNIIGTQRDSLLSVLLNEAAGNDSLISKLESDSGGKFSGKMYTFKADTESYSGYLNSLCRACSLLMGIGDKVMPHTSTKLKDFDYSYWTIRKRYASNYNNSIGNEADSDTSLWKRFMGGLLKEAKTLKTTATDSTIYINFFLSGGESSVSESISTDVEDSPVKGLVDNVSEVGKKINYFTGSGFAIGGEDLEKGLATILNTNGGIGLLSMAENFLKGGRMIFPKMVGTPSYGQEISCSMKFVSPYGDKYSIFLRCIVPLCHILAMALPRQLSDNMFTFPFVIKAFQLGQFNIELGVINSLSIRRGGDDTSWTVDGLATEWNVDFTILPLVDELMITSEKNPFLFMKNNNLIAYLCNFCGFDALSYSVNVKADIMRSFIRNRVYSIPRSLGHRLDDITYNKLNHILTMSNYRVF